MRRLVTLIIILGLAIVLYIGHPWLLGGMGRYLVYETPLERADVIVVLSGGSSTPARVLEAVDLYREGYAKRVILTTEVKPNGYDRLAARGVKLPTSTEISVTILKRLGIPMKDVDVVREEAYSTLSELCSVTAHLEGKPARSVILVTDQHHSRRASRIMQRLTNGRIRVLSHPTKYDEFHPDTWWQHRDDLKEVLFEYEKLANYWLVATKAMVLSAADRLPGVRISVRNSLCPTKPKEGKAGDA
ncbi:MAG: YdcF family protein [candidate division NC10 bacterium]|nr:YdcF family protein [candidate division NC10 bacterium]